jgi:hypothetical protein
MDGNTYVEAQIETQPPESPGFSLFVFDKDKSIYVGNIFAYTSAQTGTHRFGVA